MHRLLFLLFLFASVVWAPLAGAVQAPSATLPDRPTPFRFVNDQAQLLTAADAQKLESGLRRYADNTGTQVVVVTVPTLGGQDVADYGRALGESWGVGQRDKNNGLIVLLSAQERKVTIQAGSGLQSAITPALTNRVITQDMTPSFKQGNYFAGLRKGLSSLMLAANPGSNPRNEQPATSTDESLAAASNGAVDANAPLSADLPPATEAQPAQAAYPTPAPVPSSGFSMSTLLLGALVIGGIIWLITRLFRRSSSAASPAGNPTPNPSAGPDFLPNRATGPNYNQNNRPQSAPDFLPNRAGGLGGSGIGGSGVGGMLMTGAAAAAGAYLGNRMANDHDTPHSEQLNPDTPAAPLGYGTAGPATSGGFPALDNSNAADTPAPDYFSDEATDAGPDYFSSDNTSYDDPSSGDVGGGGFDDTDDNSGSW